MEFAPRRQLCRNKTLLDSYISFINGTAVCIWTFLYPELNNDFFTEENKHGQRKADAWDG